MIIARRLSCRAGVRVVYSSPLNASTMNEKVQYPANYKPLQKLEICTNILIGGGDIAHYIGPPHFVRYPPIIVGQGEDIPLVWLYARVGDQWVPFIEKSKSNH